MANKGAARNCPNHWVDFGKFFGSDWLRKTDTEAKHPFDKTIYIPSELRKGLDQDNL